MMAMTIHADDVFAKALHRYARKSGKSVNQTVKDILAPIIGIVKKQADDSSNPFMQFCGVLPKEENDELGKALEAQRKIVIGSMPRGL